jgi:hypothetical protein
MNKKLVDAILGTCGEYLQLYCYNAFQVAKSLMGIAQNNLSASLLFPKAKTHFISMYHDKILRSVISSMTRP